MIKQQHIKLVALLVALLNVYICKAETKTFNEPSLGHNSNNVATGSKDLVAHLKILSSKEFMGRKPGSAGHKKAQQYISKLLIDQTLKGDTSFVMDFEYGGLLNKKQGKNFGFIKVGNKNPEQFIIITAHYDHLGKKGARVFHGADDNASGIAVLLSLKPWLETQEFNFSIMLLATDAEEPGLFGAKAFITQTTILPEHIKLNLNLDMLGYDVRNNSIFVAGLKHNPHLKDIIDITNKRSSIQFKPKERLNSSSRSAYNNKINLHKASDHYEFHKVGIPYLLITGDNHKYYHTPNDTFERIDLKFYKNVYFSLTNLILNIDRQIKVTQG